MARSDHGTTHNSSDVTSSMHTQEEQQPVGTTSEQQRLPTWNATHQSFPQDLYVSQLIEQQAAKTPDALAVMMGNQQLSYKELNQQANQLAYYLQAYGVRPGTRVGICLERSLDIVVGQLGILKAGAAYVPMDPSYPDERLTFMLSDADISVLVTRQAIATRLAVQGVRMIRMDSDAALLAEESVTDPQSAVTGDDVSYVIYTSGSTGQPKGVQVTHRSLLNLIFWCRQTFALTAADRTTQFASPSFDVNVKELWPALTVGASVHILAEHIRGVPVAIRDWLVDQGITLTILPTIIAEHLIALDWPTTTALRFLLTGGDILHSYPPSTLPFAFINNYGPTEATVVTTYKHVLPTSDPDRAPSIGKPILNAQIYILDEQLRQVPIGDTGELYIGGVNLAKGYLKRPELTAERFISHPFSAEPGARLYKTGDLVRYRVDGDLEFVGRIDTQVKIRGHRIEVGEIEALLQKHTDVKEAVVVTREDTSGDKRLVAYATLHEGSALTAADLQVYTQHSLPAYMVPSAFMLLATMPITSNGKIDRSALPAPEIVRLPNDASFVAPTSLLQNQLARIWEELLDVRPISIKDNFFTLGGHSLLAARLVAEIAQVSGKQLPLATLFAGPTIEQLAEALTTDTVTSSRAPVIAIQASGSQRPFFFLHGDWTGGAFYCFTLASTAGPDQPFYALEPFKFSGLQHLPTIEEIAAAHIQAIRTVQPEGPYQLGGFCNGGLIAYEIARQLSEAGQQVHLLTLITPSASGSTSKLLATISHLGKWLHVQPDIQARWYLRARHALRHVYRYLRPGDSKLLDFAQLVTIDARLNTMFPPRAALYNDYVGVFSWLVSRYALPTYAGKVTLYWASEEPIIEQTWYQEPAIANKPKQELEHHFIPGTHMSCVTDHIQILAAHLSTTLHQFQEETPSQSA